tara:strand:- start:14434 stop:15537 length:1104 start_codon:yes stop_codon:yes gene_type:complete
MFFSVCQAQKKEVFNKDNKGQSYAILSAQGTKDVFSLAQKNYFSTNFLVIKENCDSMIIFSNNAVQYADSALLFACDSCNVAKERMLLAKFYQLKVLEYCSLIKNENSNESIHLLSEKLMDAAGNGIVEAYAASLYFEKEEEEEGKLDLVLDEEVEDVYYKEIPREISKLEIDEISYMTIKELYGKRLAEIDDELISLKKRAEKSRGNDLAEVNKVIAHLVNEEEKCFEKMRGSEDRLVSVRNELSLEMLKVVHKDIFSSEKEGFYNENVPIPEINEIPIGLVYKIQIGFFKSQLPSEHFNGIFPLSSQKIDDTYYRYVAGNFAKYQDAKDAKVKVVEKGYTDSFVVAFLNGEKVSISDALENEENK